MKSPEQGPSDSPIIRLIENREVIEKKLREYESRLDQFKAPEVQLDTIYKIEVAKSLVDTGEVNIYELANELNTKYGFFDSGKYDNACGVIIDYIKTGGKNNLGGTGLNTEKIDEQNDDGMIM